MYRRQATETYETWRGHLAEAITALDGIDFARWNNGAYGPDGRVDVALHHLQVMRDTMSAYRAADEWLYEHG